MPTQIVGDEDGLARQEPAGNGWRHVHFSFVASSGIFFASDFMKFHNVEARKNSVF